MTLKNAVTKGVKAWRDRRVGYWLCIDPKTGEYYLLTSAALAELNGLKVMYRLPAVYYRVVLTRDWNVKLGPHVIGTHLDTSAYIKDLDGFFARIEAKNKVELRKAKNISRTSRRITNLNFTKMVFVYDIGKSRWQADFGREALEFGRDHFTLYTGNYVITVDPKKYRIFDRAEGKPLVNGVVRIDEQDMKDILAAAPKSQRGWIRTRLGYMVAL